MKNLRNLIRLLVEEILAEPDLSSEDGRKNDDTDKDEQNVVANIAGVTTPLGTGPSYPAGRKKVKRKKAPEGDKDWYKT